MSDAHYMVWDGQHLIVASTGNNSLLWITLAGEVVRRWRAPGEDDSWHLNDVYLLDDHLYACAFGKYAHYRGYKDDMWRGDGFVFDVDSGHEVASGLCAPHNPRYFDGAWTVCDSLRASVVQFDTANQRTREAKLRSFTRGVAITDDYLIVGESANRKSDDATKGSIAILRRSDFSFVARIELPFPEVSEIVAAPPELVDAAKIGFRTNPLRTSESDQLQMFRDVGIEPKRLWAVSEALAPSDCSIRIDAVIPEFICGKLALVECTVTNLGEAFLCSELPHPVHLSYKWLDTPGSPVPDPGEGIRTRLTRTLPPGSSIRCRMEILAPKVPGEFELLLTLVQEGVAWFNGIDAANAYSAKVNVVGVESEHLVTH